jgi:diphthine-ammonia ligase
VRKNLKVAALWTGGKDSSLACYKAMKDKYDVALIVTFIWEKPSLAHPLSVIKLQSEVLRIPFLWDKLKAPYFEAYREAISELKKEYGVEGVVTGDISYVDSFHGNWIDDVCKGTGVEVVKPLWGLDRSQILEELIASGFKVIITCAKEPWLDEKWLGRTIDTQSMKDLKEVNKKNGMDLCGEMGEYHTMTLGAPFFTKTIQVSEFKKEKIDNAFVLEPIGLSLAPK